MAGDQIEDCKKTIQEDLSEVLAVLEFGNAAFKASANVGQILAWVAPQPELHRVVDEFRSAKLTDLNIFYQSLFVQIWSSFELSLRNLMTAYLVERCKKADDFDSLHRAKVIERNLYHTGIALQQILENRSHLDLEFFDIAKNVGTSIPNSLKVSLNAKTFTIFLRGPSAQGIEEALKRIGFATFDWDVLGRDSSIQRLFGTRSARETSKQLTQFLSNAERIRNHIVHRGEKIQPVTENDLRQHAAVFEAVATILSNYLLTTLNAA
jgi:hypothetical protein